MEGTYEIDLKLKDKTSWTRITLDHISYECLKNALEDLGIEVKLADTSYRSCKNPSF